MKVFDACRMLSIDILLGVFSCFLFASHLLSSNTSQLIPLILCAAVWLVYTIDHLADSYYLGDRAVKPVYRWHWKNRRILIAASLTLTVSGIILCMLFLSPGMLYVGLAGTGILLVYMLVHSLPFMRKRYFFKEVWVAGIYTLGIWALPILFRGMSPDLTVLFLVAAFGCLVMINVLSYTFFEYSLDMQEGLQTLAVRYGEETCRIIIYAFFIISLVLLSSCLAVHHEDPVVPAAVIILLIMELFLSMIHLFPGYFSRNGLYGILADAVFLLPAGIVFF